MDWISLLDDNHIAYVTSGPNTKKGEVSVKCPWCGQDDPSEHLGINLEHEAWGCHCNQAHRGKRPYYLVQGLLGCSLSQAKLIVAQYDKADPETLQQAISSLTGEKEPPIKPAGALKLPPEVQPIPPKGRFADYVRSRGFDDPVAVADMYSLSCCTTGRWKDRIIIPVYSSEGKLLAWTGRAIQRPVSAPRYLSSSDAIKTTLYNLDVLLGGDTLFVTEGPFDAIKVDYHCYAKDVEYDCDATAVFGTSITLEQVSLLNEISKWYYKVVILLDADAIEQAFNLSDWLSNAVIGQLPDGVADPGDLNKDQVKELINQYCVP